MTTLQDFRRAISHFVDGRRKRRQLRLRTRAARSHGVPRCRSGGCRSRALADRALIKGCAGSRELLDRMLARLGIDAAQLPVEDMRDMTWTCMTCPDKRKCREWLAEIEETDFRSFCPNAASSTMPWQPAVPAGWRHPNPPAAGGPNDSAYHPTADDLRRMRAEASQRETRALLDGAHLFSERSACPGRSRRRSATKVLRSKQRKPCSPRSPASPGRDADSRSGKSGQRAMGSRLGARDSAGEASFAVVSRSCEGRSDEDCATYGEFTSPLVARSRQRLPRAAVRGPRRLGPCRRPADGRTIPLQKVRRTP